MRSTFLLGVAAVAFAASAQTVQDIPNTEPLKLEGEYSVIEVATLPDDGSEPKARTKEDNGIVQFDNMCNDDYAQLKLNNTITSPYILSFEAGCKIDGTSVEFTLTNEEGDIAWSNTFYPANNNKGWQNFVPVSLFIEDPLEAGVYTFGIKFLNEAGGTKSTVNLREFVFEARESIVTYSLYTTVDPGDEAGSIVCSPNQDTYLEGSEVTLTATANSGYKFAKWEINGDFYEENPYTLIITESTDVFAYFDELKMDNDVPGWIDLYTRAGNAGKLETKTKCNVDGEVINDGAECPLLGDYRNGQFETFDLNVLQNGNYQLHVQLGGKAGEADQPKLIFDIYDKDAYETDSSTAEPEWSATLDCTDKMTGQWNVFNTQVLDNVNLTEGKKIFKITFIEETSNKYTVNIIGIGFSLDGSFGAGVENVMTQDAPAKAYNVLGVEVDSNYKGLIILSNGQKMIQK